MNEAELFEAFLGFTEQTFTVHSILITIISAYLIAIFLAGAKLSRLQLVIVSGAYSAFFLLELFGLLGLGTRSVELAQDIVEMNPNREFLVNQVLVNLQVAIFLLFFLASLVFAFQIRWKAKKKLEQT